jgi:hypothetical protein
MEGAVFARKTMLIALALVLGSTSSGFARNEFANFSIREALKSPAAKEALDPQIRLSFGHRTQGGAAKPIGRWKSSKSAGISDDPKVACHRSFIVAVDALQRRAKKEGGDAVIDISSYTDHRETSSADTYVCRLGEHRAAVALIGSVVRAGR